MERIRLLAHEHFMRSEGTEHCRCCFIEGFREAKGEMISAIERIAAKHCEEDSELIAELMRTAWYLATDEVAPPPPQ